MSEHSPNREQDRLIQSHDGLHLVDAGPGTGKTFTLTRRYAALIEAGVDPEDILLTTFTRNAAETMRDRIIERIDAEHELDVVGAPISTFHAHCQGLLETHGADAPQYLGIDQEVPRSVRVIDAELFERQEFERFMAAFRQDHPEHSGFYGLMEPGALLKLVRTLAARGVVPDADGWYRESREVLEGDQELLRAAAEEANAPRNEGRKQSELAGERAKVFRKGRTVPGAPQYGELKEGKQVRRDLIEEAIDDDREQLFAFIHDLYHGYLRHCLERNYLNFGFVMLLTYVVLREDPRLREVVGFEHTMIDEFQDTNPLQFRIALLLSRTDNICAVGDWKQSIYRFQHADVDNIRRFEDRIQRFHAGMQDALDWEPGAVTAITLRENYRSVQDIIDHSEGSFTAPGRAGEEVDAPDITQLEADRDGAADIRQYVAEDQHEAITDIIIDLLEDGEDPSDITVLSRTRSFARELFEHMRDTGVPAAYAGGIELFRTDPGVLVLNWLRLVADRDVDRGWVTVLDEAGYRMDEKAHILDAEEYPEEMVRFRDRLAGMDSVPAMARAVLDRYGYDGEEAATIVDVLGSHTSHGWMTVGRTVRFIEDCITEEEDFEVDADRHGDAVTIQTIHGAKGLEYGTVILGDCTAQRFPSRDRGGGTIWFDELSGLRCKKTVQDHPVPYDSWQARLVDRVTPDNRDEERRLLYVAITRAEDRFIAVGDQERPSPFLEHLGEPEEREVERTEYAAPGKEVVEGLTVREVERTGPVRLDPHSLMEIEGTGGAGMEAGTTLHQQAERYIRYGDVPEEVPDQLRIVVDHLDRRGEAEVACTLHLDGDPPVVFSGVIDHLLVEEDRVTVTDIKTDADLRNHDQYQVQLSVYAHAMEREYPDREVIARVLYTNLDRCETIQPSSEAALLERAHEVTQG